MSFSPFSPPLEQFSMLYRSISVFLLVHYDTHVISSLHDVVSDDLHVISYMYVLQHILTWILYTVRYYVHTIYLRFMQTLDETREDDQVMNWEVMNREVMTFRNLHNFFINEFYWGEMKWSRMALDAVTALVKP